MYLQSPGKQAFRKIEVSVTSPCEVCYDVRVIVTEIDGVGSEPKITGKTYPVSGLINIPKAIDAAYKDSIPSGWSQISAKDYYELTK